MAHLQVFCSSLVGCALALASLPVVAAPLHPGVAGLTLVQPSDEDTAKAKAAYEEGEKAYRLGKFGDAAVAFEEAYELSGFPDILYNIGLAHLRWYDVEPDVAHLRKARVVFQNYVIEIQKNPELGDLDEAEAMIAQIDEKIAAAEAAAAESSGGGGESGSGPAQPVDLGPDPGKKLRLGGAIAMGVGGAFIVAGAVSGVVLGVRSQGFEEDLTNAYAEYNGLGCSAGDARMQCDELNDAINVYRDNGQLANALAVGLGLTFGGIGVIGVATGAVLFIQGNKKTKSWEQRKVVVAPSWTPGGGGLVVSGSF